MFNYDVARPTDVISVSDWVELYVTYMGEGISRAQVSSKLESSLGREPAEDFLIDIWNELKTRQELYGEAPPIMVENRMIEPTLDWVEHPHYMTYLIFALEGNPNTDTTTADQGGKLFEELCLYAIKNYVQGEAIIYGYPSKISLKDITNNHLKERFNLSPPDNRNDRNLDIFAWKSFGDGRASQIIVLVQCAAGENWKGKLSELSLNAWRTYINFAVSPIKGFSAPITLTDSRELLEHSLDAGIFFDRLRLFKFTPKLPEDLRQKSLDWCNTRLDQIIN